MTTRVFSREFLQGLPEQRKQQAIHNGIQSFIQSVQESAAIGRTSCIFEPPSCHTQLQTCPPQPALTITIDDYIQAFKQIFPECMIEYREVWVELSSTSRTLKKGIVVDWS